MEAAFRDLAAALQSMACRKPMWVLLEPTAGLWRVEEHRRRLEMMVLDCRGYDWEQMLTSPHVHAGEAERRWRLGIMGVIKSKRWLRDEVAEAGEEAAEGEGGEAAREEEVGGGVGEVWGERGEGVEGGGVLRMITRACVMRFSTSPEQHFHPLRRDSDHVEHTHTHTHT